MPKVENADRKNPSSPDVRREIRSNVEQLLAFDGIPREQADLWIRVRLFGRFSRCVQAAVSALGIDHCIPELQLVRDFSEARCTEDVIDALHQHQKMRVLGTLIGGLMRPNHSRVLRTYWRLRYRVEKAGRLRFASQDGNCSRH